MLQPNQFSARISEAFDAFIHITFEQDRVLKERQIFLPSMVLHFYTACAGNAQTWLKYKAVTVQPAELLLHPAIENRFAMGWMPAGAMLSYGLRSKCVDLVEL